MSDDSGDSPRWTAKASTSTAAVSVIAVAAVAVVTVLILTGAHWGFTASMVLILVIAFSLLLPWQVSADARGLRVVAASRLVRFQIPVDDIVSVNVIDVSPVREFGGWGIRFGSGQFGVITRKGPALRVHRHSTSRAFVVTVDDAETGAALLNALSHR